MTRLALHERPRRLIAAASFVLGSLALAGAAFAALSQARLEQAHAMFLTGKFTAVLQILSPYDRQPPRKLSIDFMLAVSKCRTGKTSDGLSRLIRLHSDYPLTKVKSDDVVAQIADCAKGQLPIAGVVAKGDAPGAKIDVSFPATPTKPEMSGLEAGWSYNQGDIYSRKAASAMECSRICLAEKRCRAMTYIHSQGRCWIKDRVPTNRGSSTDMTSAIKLFN